MKSLQLWITGIKECKEIQMKGTEKSFNKIVKEIFSQSKRGVYQDKRSAQNIKETEPEKQISHIIITKLSVQNKERY